MAYFIIQWLKQIYDFISQVICVYLWIDDWQGYPSRMRQTCASMLPHDVRTNDLDTAQSVSRFFAGDVILCPPCLTKRPWSLDHFTTIWLRHIQQIMISEHQYCGDQTCLNIKTAIEHPTMIIEHQYQPLLPSEYQTLLTLFHLYWTSL